MAGGAGAIEPKGALGMRVIRAAKPPVAPTVLVPERWMPEEIRQLKPKSRLGEYVKKVATLLPREIALELIDRVASAVVIESSLALKHFSGGIDPRTGRFVAEEAFMVADYGIVSRKAITNAGVNFIAARMAGGAAASTIANFNYHGIGKSSTVAESQTNTSLQAELTTEYLADNTRPTGTPVASSYLYQTVGTVTVDAGTNVMEHGVFDQAATGGGTLLDRHTFALVTLSANDSLQTTYNFTLTAGG